MNRADDIRLLGLENGNFTDQELKAAYRKMAMKTHPDKPGGSKEAFQKLSSAFERLRQPNNQGYAPSFSRSTSSPWSGTTGRGASFFHPFSFFGGGFPFGGMYSEDEDDVDDTFFFIFFEHLARGMHRRSTTRRRTKSRSSSASSVQKDVGAKYDSRDKRSCGSNVCNTCLDRNGLAQQDAQASGVNWYEYNAHPDKLQTCWACKNSHQSVMTEKMAYSKYGKKLAYDPVFFNTLRRSGKSFHQRPFRKARVTEYFWAADLEKEATARGWVPKKREAADGGSPGSKKQKTEA